MTANPNQPVRPSARTQGRTQAAILHTENHDHGNYNLTRAPGRHDQRGDQYVTPVQVTGSEDGTLSGLWPAKVRYWSGYAGGTPANFADRLGPAACWAFPAPGGADLTNTGEYLGLFVGLHTDGKAVFEVVSPAGGGGLNTQNTDGTEIDSTTTDIRANRSTGSQFTQSGGITTHTLLAASPTQMGAVTTGSQTFAGDKFVGGGSRLGLSNIGNGFCLLGNYPTTTFDEIGNFYVGLNCAGVTLLLLDDATSRVIFAGGAGATPRLSISDGTNLRDGGTVVTGGLTFVGGVYISGTISVAAADVTGLATVATTGSYADITGTKPPATTTVSATYNSGTKDLTVTINGVSAVVNLT